MVGGDRTTDHHFGEIDRQMPLWHAERTIAAAVNSPQRERKICQVLLCPA
jgi:hypothetical protein